MKMRLVDGFVADLSEDPEASFVPPIAAEFVDVPEGAPADLRPGYAYDGKTWTAPAEPDQPAPSGPSYRTVMSAVRFKAQFTLQEQIAIKLARSYVAPNPTDPTDKKLQAKLALDALFDNLADLVLLGTEIDVADPAVIAGIDFCRSIGILASDDRAAAIKKGVPV